MQEMTYKVYALLDATGRVVAINSSVFLPDTNGWTLIDEGIGDKYHHAQGNYLDKPLTDDRGVYLYKLVNGEVVERTQEEMDADYAPSTISPTQEERIAALEKANTELLELLDILLSGATEEDETQDEET